MNVLKKIKIIFLFIVVSQILTGCIVLDITQTNRWSYRGDEAADKIIDAAIVADLVASGGRFGILALIADRIAQIEEEKYYTKESVDACVNSINGIVGYVAGSLIANVLECDVRVDPLFVNIGPIEL